MLERTHVRAEQALWGDTIDFRTHARARASEDLCRIFPSEVQAVSSEKRTQQNDGHDDRRSVPGIRNPRSHSCSSSVFFGDFNEHSRQPPPAPDRTVSESHFLDNERGERKRRAIDRCVYCGKISSDEIFPKAPFASRSSALDLS